MFHKNPAATAAAPVGLAVAFLMLTSAPAIPVTSGASGYRLLKTIHLDGTEGWDYINMDSAARRLYIGRGSYMDVVDVDSGVLVAKLEGMPGVHGIALIPELGRGFSVNGDDTSTNTRPEEFTENRHCQDWQGSRLLRV